MYKLKLVIDNYERWANNLFYEYFYPVKPDEEFYRKFLYKNFPYKFSDAYDLFPYNERSIPSIKPTELDKKLQEESLQNASSPFRNGFTSYIRMRTQAPDENVIRERYYNELALARHTEGLDYGMAPNYTYNYDKYIRPGQNMRASTEYNLAGGILNLELNSGDSDEYLYEWMLSGTMKQGKLVFYDGDLDQAFKIEFWDCYCIGIGEHMSSEGNTSMKLNLRLSPAITRNRGVEHQKVWKKTDITPTMLSFNLRNQLATPTEVEEEMPKPELIQLYWTDMDGNRLYGPQKGNNLLVVHSKGGVGKSVNFNLKSSVSYRFKYQGAELEDDQLKDYTLTADIDKLEIEAF